MQWTGLGLYAGTVMTSFHHVMIPTHGNWFLKNPLEHESNDRDVLPMVNLFGQQNYVTVLWFRETEIKTGSGYWFSCESGGSRFPKFTDNFCTVSSKHLKPGGGYFNQNLTWM